MMQLRSMEPIPALQLGPAGDGAIWGTTAIAARIRWLIAHHDGGDVCAAARRLAVPVGRLVRLEETLGAGDEALLANVVVRYGVGAGWLLTGCEQPDPAELRPDVGDRLARLLLAAAHRMADELAGAPGA